MLRCVWLLRFLSLEIHAGVAWIVVGLFDRRFFWRKTFQTSPGLDERAVHCEVCVAHPAFFLRQPGDGMEENLRRIALQQALLIDGESGNTCRLEDRVLHAWRSDRGPPPHVQTFLWFFNELF